MRDYVRRLLEPFWTVESVEDGAKALIAVAARPPDLVLADVMMPGVDGFALLRQLRQDPGTATIPVVLLSARAGEEAEVEGLQAGADDYLIKPFSARELVARVRTHLDLSRLRQEESRRIAATAREREQLVAELQRAVQLSELFVGILGHDLRNPLTAITTAASLIARRAGSDQFVGPVGHIKSSAGRMERMISQLLDLTRIRLGDGIPLDRRPGDMEEVVRLATGELVAAFPDRVIALDITGSGVGTWDRDRLAQLVSNLVGNACQHGSLDHPVQVRLDGSAPDGVRLEVSNHGVIAPELLPFIFDPLRSDGGGRGSRQGASGVGLGLYITQQIAVAHGGTIEVQSTEQQGTRFMVELPRYAPMLAKTAFGSGDTPPA
jgi:signal transduction histidine kinase